MCSSEFFCFLHWQNQLQSVTSRHITRLTTDGANPQQPYLREDTMTADALKKITTDALDKLAALLDEGHSDQLTALLKTMARFHKYSWLCDSQHSQENVFSPIM